MKNAPSLRLTHFSTRKYHWLIYPSLLFLLVIIGFFLRLYHVDTRPLHHDESLHGMYSLYALKNPTRSFYKYKPLLHGPFLYNILPWVIKYFGSYKFSIRLPSVFIGSLFILFPVLFKKTLNKRTILTLSFLIALGPTFIYWSRFIRHDTFVLLSFFIFTYALTSLKGPLKSIFIAIALALHFSTKENFFVHMALLLGITIYESLSQKILHFSSPTLFQRFIRYIKDYPLSSLFSILLFLTISSFFYTAGFVYWDGFWDGLYRKSFLYWITQHQQERITGPFVFSFFINSVYVVWWLPALFIHLFFFYKSQSWKIRSLFLISFIPALCITLFKIDYHHWKFGLEVLKLKIGADYFLFFPLIFHALIGTTSYLKQGKKNLAYSLYLFTATLFSYSYLGEKVPWLALYPLIAGLIFFGYEFEHLFTKKILLLLLLLTPKIIYNISWVNYSHKSDPYNLLTQVHTEKKFEKTMLAIRKEMNSFKKGHAPRLLSRDGSTWPTVYYFHGRPEYSFSSKKKDLPLFKYILAQWNDKEANKLLKKGYKKEKLPFRQWWVPAYDQANLSKLLHYWWNFTPWNSSGGSQLALFKRIE